MMHNATETQLGNGEKRSRRELLSASANGKELKDFLNLKEISERNI